MNFKGFKYNSNNELCCEHVSLKELGDVYKTPLYVYSGKSIVNSYKSLKKSLSNTKTKINFALKATPSNINVYKKLFVMHIYNEELKAALKVYEKHVYKTDFVKTAVPVLKKFVKLKTNGKALGSGDFARMLKNLNDVGHRWLANGMMRTRMANTTKLEWRIFLINNGPFRVREEFSFEMGPI